MNRAVPWLGALLCRYFGPLSAATCAGLFYTAACRQRRPCFWLSWLIIQVLFSGVPVPVSLLIFAVYAARTALQMSIFRVLVKPAPWSRVYLSGALLGRRGILFSLLFPWYLANSQISFFRLVQTADTGWPYGASFVVLWFNAALSWHCSRRKRSAERVSGRLPMRPCSPGYRYVWHAAVQSVSEEMAGARKISVAQCRENVDIDMKWDLAGQKNLDSTRADRFLGAVQLVVWPSRPSRPLILKN